MKKKNMNENVIQFIKFGIVGVSNTLIGYLIYAITLTSFRSLEIFVGVDIYIAQLVMFFLSVLWSFYWNNKKVFVTNEDEERNTLLALLKTYVSYAFTGIVIAEILLHIWVNMLGISDYIAPLLSLLITVPLNFLIQKFWAFKNN